MSKRQHETVDHMESRGFDILRMNKHLVFVDKDGVQVTTAMTPSHFNLDTLDQTIRRARREKREKDAAKTYAVNPTVIFGIPKTVRLRQRPNPQKPVSPPIEDKPPAAVSTTAPLTDDDLQAETNVRIIASWKAAISSLCRGVDEDRLQTLMKSP